MSDTKYQKRSSDVYLFTNGFKAQIDHSLCNIFAYYQEFVDNCWCPPSTMRVWFRCFLPFAIIMDWVFVVMRLCYRDHQGAYTRQGVRVPRPFRSHVVGRIPINIVHSQWLNCLSHKIIQKSFTMRLSTIHMHPYKLQLNEGKERKAQFQPH